MNVADAKAIPYRSGECVEGGRALAQAVGDAYRALDPNASIAIGGSVGRGDADRFSDLEIVAFWSRLPEPGIRARVVASLGGELWTMDRDGETMEHFGLGELEVRGRVADGTSMISVEHRLMDDVEATIHRVFELCGTDSEDHAFLAVLRDAIPLNGAECLRRWQARIADYPDALVAAVVRENLPFGPWFVPHALALRGDRLTLHGHMHVVERHLLRVLAALSRSFVAFPSGNWARRSDGWLRVKPSGFRERLDGCYGSDLVGGWEAMRVLMMETIDLVEDRGLDLRTDTSEPLTDWARRRWDPLPPYTLMLEASQILQG